MGAAMSTWGASQPAAGPWQPDEFLAQRVEHGRSLLAESEEHRGDVDLQARGRRWAAAAAAAAVGARSRRGCLNPPIGSPSCSTLWVSWMRPLLWDAYC